MALVTINGNYLSQTANAIRRKLKTNDSYAADQMPAAIATIPDLWDWVKDDGDTYCYIDITSKYQLSLSLRLKLTGTIDWGDNTTTVCAHSAVTEEPHTYDALGQYIIKITHDSGTTVTFGGDTMATGFIGNGTTTRFKAAILKKLEIGRDISLSKRCFEKCDALELLYIRAYDADPDSSTGGGRYSLGEGFPNCLGLKRIKSPHALSFNASSIVGDKALEEVETDYDVTISGGASQGLSNLRRFGGWIRLNSNSATNWLNSSALEVIKIVPASSTVTTIYNGFASSMRRVDRIYLKSGITKIVATGFSSTPFRELHLESTTPPELAATTAIAPIADYSTIYVPASAVNTYKAATNWAEHANFIKAEVEEWT